jgi:hypothetical protein
VGLEVEGGSATIVKRGEIVIQALLSRTWDGLSVSVKVHPRVEDFFRKLAPAGSTGENVLHYGRYWTPVKKDATLSVYTLGHAIPPIQFSNGATMRLDQPGTQLQMVQPSPVTGRAETILNLSFIRLIGASEGAGVTFHVNGVYTTDAVKEIRDAIGKAGQAFYREYMTPIDLDVQISTQDIPR